MLGAAAGVILAVWYAARVRRSCRFYEKEEEEEEQNGTEAGTGTATVVIPGLKKMKSPTIKQINLLLLRPLNQPKGPVMYVRTGTPAFDELIPRISRFSNRISSNSY
jgi:hypothetical protein